jgi:hypothetical protein
LPFEFYILIYFEGVLLWHVLKEVSSHAADTINYWP